jgi:hypothetical protein
MTAAYDFQRIPAGGAMRQNETEIGDQNCGRLLNLRSHSTQAYEMRPAHLMVLQPCTRLSTVGSYGLLIRLIPCPSRPLLLADGHRREFGYSYSKIQLKMLSGEGSICGTVPTRKEAESRPLYGHDGAEEDCGRGRRLPSGAAGSPENPREEGPLFSRQIVSRPVHVFITF